MGSMASSKRFIVFLNHIVHELTTDIQAEITLKGNVKKACAMAKMGDTITAYLKLRPYPTAYVLRMTEATANKKTEAGCNRTL